MFYIVKFTKTNQVAVVPDSWVVNNTCYWPPDADDGQDESKLAQGKTIPKSDWVPWEITTLKSFSKTTKLTFIIKKTSYGF
jgi:hypothetical protein